MLCLPIHTAFCDSPVEAVVVAPADLLLHSYPLLANNNNNSSSSSSSSLYTIPLPPHPLPFDSFSTPSSSTPCSLPAIRSWSSSSLTTAPGNTTTAAPPPPTTTTTTTTTNNNNNNTTPNQPLVLDPLTASKVGMAENLVDTTALIIESIWPSPSGAQYSNKAPVIPLHIFVKETLRRSRTTLATLQLALYYIYKVRNQVLAAQEKIRLDQIQQQQQRALQLQLPLSPNGSIEAPSEDDFKHRDYFNTISALPHHTLTTNKHSSHPITPPVTNNTPASLSPLSLSASTSTSPILAKSEPVGCGRRMFLAALILASKFQQDRTYSNKAWSKISGLPVSEINLNEITFLKLIDYRLFVSQAVFQKWITILAEKGRIRERANMNRSSSMLSTDGSKRRSSIQYCTNTLPSRMTCVTASSLEQQQQHHHHHHHQLHQQLHQEQQLPSFSFILEKSMSLPAPADCQFDFAPTLPKLTSVDNSSSTGLVQSESLPRQQQGMGAYLTHRWVQAQRREYLKSRMQAMGYNFAESPRSSPLVTPQMAVPESHQHESQGQYGMILNNYQNNIITFSPARTFSLDRTTQRSDTKLSLVSDKHKHVQDFMPSPASSPKAVAGLKRRASEAEESDMASANANDMQSRTRRRLSVSFLVDC